MRALIAPAAVLLLSACWDGEGLYTATDARPAVAPGTYRTINARGEVSPSVLRISLLPDGMTHIQADPGGAEESLTMGFAPLDAEGAAFAAWAVPGGMIDGRAVTFGLLRRAANGAYVYIVPMCDETLSLATAAGAVPQGRDALACHFTSRASLEAALRSLPADAAELGEVVRLVPA